MRQYVKPMDFTSQIIPIPRFRTPETKVKYVGFATVRVASTSARVCGLTKSSSHRYMCAWGVIHISGGEGVLFLDNIHSRQIRSDKRQN